MNAGLWREVSDLSQDDEDDRGFCDICGGILELGDDDLYHCPNEPNCAQVLEHMKFEAEHADEIEAWERAQQMAEYERWALEMAAELSQQEVAGH